MNLVGHLVVGMWVAAVEPTDDVALGAMLPDLAAMAGLRVERARLPSQVAEGVGLHHRADAVFHAQTWFVEAVTADSRALQDAGLPRGAARACAHVGVELLLDGLLLERAPVADSLRVALAGLTSERLGALTEAEAERWEGLFRRLRDGDRLTGAYATAVGVAERLSWILARRPRLRLDRRHTGVLIERLETRRAELEGRAEARVAAVVGDLAGFGSA
ncbi:MAG: hypothetical protein WHS89_07635 [Acidimicrobiales bacterium]